MLKINIISIGKISQDYLKTGIGIFLKRIKPFCKLEIIEIKEIVNNQINLKLQNEANKINTYLNKGFNIVCDISNGKNISSQELASKINHIQNSYSEINFVIGSSNGLDNIVKEKAHFLWSFSKLTFPHQLFKLLLLEQIYRAFQINNNHNYHK